MMMFRSVTARPLATSLAVLSMMSITQAELPLPVSEIRREEPVDFAKEIAPLLKQNCLACHHAKESEGGLNLETHESILAGGDNGPSVVAADVATSLLMTRATGAEEPLMPPEDNSVGAKPFTPEQLGLLKLWIEQGAKGGEAMAAEAIQWQTIPESIRTVYAMDISADGRMVASGRGNRTVIFDLHTKSEVGRLIDPSLAQASHGDVTDLDLIQSIAFSPDGDRIATGGYRTVKIWRQTYRSIPADETSWSSAAGLLAVNADQSAVAMVNAIGDVEVRKAADHGLLQTFVSEIDPITGLAWSGDRVFSCDQRGRVTCWDTTSGKKVAEMVSPRPLSELVATDGVDVVAALNDQGKVVLWRLTPGKEGAHVLEPVELEAAKAIVDANALRLTSKPTPMLIVASESAGVLLINLSDGKLVRKIDHGSAVESLDITADGSQLATGGRDGKARTWSVADGKALATFQGAPDGRLRLAHATVDAERQKAAVTQLTAMTAELEKTVTKEAEALKKVTEERDKAVAAVAAEEKKRVDAVAKLATAETAIAKAKTDTDQANQLLAQSQQSLAGTKGQSEKLAADLKTRSDLLAKANAAAAAAQQQIDAASQALAAAKAEAEKIAEEVKASQAAISKVNEEATKAQQAIATANKTIADAKKRSDDSTKQLDAQKKAVTAAEASKKTKDADLAKRTQAFDTATLAHRRSVDAVPAHKSVIDIETSRQNLLDQKLERIRQRAADRDRAVMGVVFAADGQTLATAHAGGQARVYRTVDGLPLSAHQRDSMDELAGVVFVGPTLCAYGKSSAPSSWAQQPQWILERTIGSVDDSPISDRVTALDFRPDGRTIAVGSGPPSRSGEVLIFSVADGQLVRDFGDVHSDTVLGLRFSPDGRLLASSAADKTVCLLDIANGKVIRSLEGHTHHVLSLAWQDDGKTIASASADQNVKVWNVESGEQKRTISGFPKEITAITFVQRSNQVVSSCADGQVRLHDTGNGKSLRSFNAAGDFLFALSVTPDGKTLVAAGQSGTIRVWSVADGKLIHEWK